MKASSKRTMGVVVIGSTGSIGLNALKVIKDLPGRFRVEGLAAHRNGALLADQIRRFRPSAAALHDPAAACSLNGTRERIPCWTGTEGVCRLAELPKADIVVMALSGAAGVWPTFRALKAGKRVALANKEALVAAGSPLMDMARRSRSQLLPVDSEHSAIFQCLQGVPRDRVKRIILTGSGGPFRTKRSLVHVTVQEALRHPTWRMGRKISVDSATLMNKGLEVIEAHHLFGVPVEAIEVVIHPQSIVHSFVEFVDGSMLAQLAVADMRLPIQYALTYPDRIATCLPSLNLPQIGQLVFEAPDVNRFPCLGLAYLAARKGGTLPAVLNASNEIAVEAFLAGRLPFLGIPRMIERVMGRHRVVSHPTMEQALAADAWAREAARGLAEGSRLRRAAVPESLRRGLAEGSRLRRAAVPEPCEGEA